MLRAAIESGLKTRFFGNSASSASKASVLGLLGPNPTMQFPGILDFLKRYRDQAEKAGVDPLGWYLPPFAYANLQVLGEAVTATNSLDQSALADYIRCHPFKTIVGDITFGRDGEWPEPRVLEVQWQTSKGTASNSSATSTPK